MAATRRIALFVEGDTELALPAFFHTWLDPQLPAVNRVGITPVKFQGIANYLDDVAAKTEMYLDQRKANVVVGVVDLYGLPPDRINLSTCATLKEIGRASCRERV